MNYFSSQGTAERYAQSRPYFHPLVMSRIRHFLGADHEVCKALDVACGTGQSTLALKELAGWIFGADPSSHMLEQATRDPSIQYLKASAENLPFVEASFDLLTVALAFHWFDRASFLSEAYRVLVPHGWLIIYDNGFHGKIKSEANFERWYFGEHLVRYPSPPRNRRLLTETTAARHGFRLAQHENYTNEVRFSMREMTDYLMTQSNVSQALQTRDERPENVHDRLLASVEKLFRYPEEIFEFGGYITYLQKTS